MDSVSQFLGIIDELTKKIRPADHGDHLSVFGEFVSGQLRQMQSDKFRTKCTHEIQQILMDWQKKDDKLLQCYEQEYIEPQHNYTIQVDSAEDIDLLDAEDESVDFEEFWNERNKLLSFIFEKIQLNKCQLFRLLFLK